MWLHCAAVKGFHFRSALKISLGFGDDFPRTSSLSTQRYSIGYIICTVQAREFIQEYLKSRWNVWQEWYQSWTSSGAGIRWSYTMDVPRRVIGQVDGNHLDVGQWQQCNNDWSPGKWGACSASDWGELFGPFEERSVKVRRLLVCCCCWWLVSASDYLSRPFCFCHLMRSTSIGLGRGCCS